MTRRPCSLPLGTPGAVRAGGEVGLCQGAGEHVGVCSPGGLEGLMDEGEGLQHRHVLAVGWRSRVEGGLVPQRCWGCASAHGPARMPFKMSAGGHVIAWRMMGVVVLAWCG